MAVDDDDLVNYTGMLSQRPRCAPVGDETAYRKWFTQRMIYQIEADCDLVHLERLEGTLLMLLEANHGWRRGSPLFRD